MKTHHRRRMRKLVRNEQKNRKGAIALLSVGIIVVILAFAAFSVDVGYLTVVKTQLQNASDASTLGSARELYDGLGPSAWKSPDEIEVEVRAAAIAVGASNRIDLESVRRAG